MKLLFRQRFFSWFDSYDIYNELGETVYTVHGKLAWGHRLAIQDAQGADVGMVREKVFTLLPRFYFDVNGQEVGCLQKEFTLFKPRYRLDLNGWQVQGNWLEWDYEIVGPKGQVATISKELFHMTDNYSMDIVDPEDALLVLMVVLAIDAEKCSRGNG